MMNEIRVERFTLSILYLLWVAPSIASVYNLRNRFLPRSETNALDLGGAAGTSCLKRMVLAIATMLQATKKNFFIGILLPYLRVSLDGRAHGGIRYNAVHQNSVPRSYLVTTTTEE